MCRARTIRRACPGPLKKSGSPNEMCCAPCATWLRMSSSTMFAGMALGLVALREVERGVLVPLLGALIVETVLGDRRRVA